LDVDLTLDVDVGGLVGGKLSRNGAQPLAPNLFASMSRSTPRSTSRFRAAALAPVTDLDQADVERSEPLGSMKLIARNETPMA
jgi:hypothetical protein